MKRCRQVLAILLLGAVVISVAGSDDGEVVASAFTRASHWSTTHETLRTAVWSDVGHPLPTSEPTQETSPELRARILIEAGLRYLAGKQNGDGSFGGNDSKQIRVALTALSTLAFLAHGDVEYRGTYHREVERAVKFLMSSSTKSGERRGYITTNGDTTSRMHGHAYATLALTQAYGMFGVKRRFASTADELQATIRAAIDIIVRSQSRTGGWMYEPFDIANDEGSMTVCMIQALRAARDCGFEVPKATIDRAITYLHKCQKADGSFRYQLIGDGQSTFELSAAACSALINAGEYYDKSIKLARDYVWGREFESFISSAPRGYPYYGLFYAVQMLWFDYDNDRTSKTLPRVIEWYERHADPTTGTYRHAELPAHNEMQYGEAYRTALATLTLQIPFGRLPIFHR